MLARVSLPDARPDRLYFAQVREDPVLEVEALRPADGQTIVIVSSGGCTALSLLASGAGRVVAVDLNPVQNHLVELKAQAVAALDPAGVVGFLGGAPLDRDSRLAAYGRLAQQLSPEARAWWDDHSKAIAGGVLNAGVTERFIGLIMKVLRTGIHPPSRIRRLLACRSLDEQRALFRREWDNRRWRLLFDVLLNRAVFRKAYQPAFFEHIQNPSFARHFRGLAEHALTDVPISTNYFVHHMLTGSYPAGGTGRTPALLGPGGCRAGDGAPRPSHPGGRGLHVLSADPAGCVGPRLRCVEHLRVVHSRADRRPVRTGRPHRGAGLDPRLPQLCRMDGGARPLAGPRNRGPAAGRRPDRP